MKAKRTDLGRAATFISKSYQARSEYLKGRVGASERLERAVMRSLRRALSENPANPRIWCLLGDHYKRRDRRAHCFRQALKASPRDPEAHAELARICAELGDRRAFARHFDQALRFSRGFDVEGVIILVCLDAAKELGDDDRAKRALILGRRRFPKLSWFLPK